MLVWAQVYILVWLTLIPQIKSVNFILVLLLQQFLWRWRWTYLVKWNCSGSGMDLGVRCSPLQPEQGSTVWKHPPLTNWIMDPCTSRLSLKKPTCGSALLRKVCAKKPNPESRLHPPPQTFPDRNEPLSAAHASSACRRCSVWKQHPSRMNSPPISVSPIPSSQEKHQ